MRPPYCVCHICIRPGLVTSSLLDPPLWPQLLSILCTLSRSLELPNAVTRRSPAHAPQYHTTLQIRGAEIRYVHLPGAVDAPELMKARLRAIDQGRQMFSRRVRKAPRERPPPEQLAPIVSSQLTEVDAYGA